LLSCALLSLPDAAFAGDRPLRVYLDAGHGVPGNSGATNASCELEQDVTLAIAKHVARKLEARGGFAVRVSRETASGPAYPARLEEAAKFGADVLISVHIDSRGAATFVEVGERSCPRSDAHRGFSVLVSEEGQQSLVEKRFALARAVASRMREAGGVAYDGADYFGLYVKDGEPGVFIDRRGLFILRRTKIPSIIVETHHGWNIDEVEVWRSEAKLDAFAESLALALESLRKKD
jgi:N-acetylmuramoyl-L-alanine amidase